MRMYRATFSFTQESDPKSPYPAENTIDIIVVEPEILRETYLTIQTDRWAINPSDLDDLTIKIKQLLTMARAHMPAYLPGVAPNYQ